MAQFMIFLSTILGFIFVPLILFFLGFFIFKIYKKKKKKEKIDESIKPSL